MIFCSFSTVQLCQDYCKGQPPGQVSNGEWFNDEIECVKIADSY